ncbi:hypothetical protein [Paenibacillus plantiphilus]|nr:hypothetical protein [Paenibacillus plantiphilus]
MGQMVVGGVTGVFENVVSQLTDNREGFSLGEVLFSGGVGFLFGGVLDVKIARRTIGDYLGSGIGKITPDWLKRGFGSIFDSFGSAVQGLSRWGSSLGGKFLYHIRDFGSRLAKDIQALPNTIRAQSKEINAKIKSWLEETGQNLNRALQGPQFAFNGGYRNGSRDVFSDPHVNRVDNGSSSGSRGPEGKGESANNFKWGNPKSTPTYGHTFSEHGAKKKPNQLIDRARGKGHQISQWLDEKSAADFLAEVAKKGPGVHDVPLPSSIKSRGYLPDGTEIKPDMARVIVKEDGGIRSAFPYSSAHPSGIGK